MSNKDLFKVYQLVKDIGWLPPEDYELTLLLIRKSIAKLNDLERKYSREIALKDAVCKGILHDPPTWEKCKDCPNLGPAFDGSGYCCALSNLALASPDLTGVKKEVWTDSKTTPLSGSPGSCQGGVLQ